MSKRRRESGSGEFCEWRRRVRLMPDGKKGKGHRSLNYARRKRWQRRDRGSEDG
ncbi:MAG: hypothetical protein GWN58_49935 [Anaerolineae bacterium]|nr:hypothetical protein [Anaerolineae bacterium]